MRVLSGRWKVALIISLLGTAGMAFVLPPLPTLVLGLVLGVSLVLLLESMDRTVKTAQDVRVRFGLTVLATLPRVDRGSDDNNGDERPLITSLASADPVVEAYRALGASLHALGGNASRKIIMVTSCLPGEGKSTVSGNLALALSQTGGRVLLVDCDLRRPSLGRMFGQPEEPGLTELLVSGDRPTFRRLDGLPFDLMTGGGIPNNPIALLDSRQMKDFLEYARKHHEYVVLDAPPVLPVTDARVLAPLADVLLMVVEPCRTQVAIVQQTIESLRAVGREIDGVILNDRSGLAAKYCDHAQDCAAGKAREGDDEGRSGAFRPVSSSRKRTCRIAGAGLLAGVLGGFLWMVLHERAAVPVDSPVPEVPPAVLEHPVTAPLLPVEPPAIAAVKPTPPTSAARRRSPEEPAVAVASRSASVSVAAAPAGATEMNRQRGDATPKATVRENTFAELQPALAAIGKVWQVKTLATGVSAGRNIEDSFAEMGLQASLLGEDLEALLQLNTPLLLEIKPEQSGKVWVAVVDRRGFSWRVSPRLQQGEWLSESDLKRIWTGWGYLPWLDPLGLMALGTDHAAPERINRLQQLLVKANCLQRFEPGILDRETVKAIGRLQVGRGLRVNGEITPETLILLYQADPGYMVPRFTSGP